MVDINNPFYRRNKSHFHSTLNQQTYLRLQQALSLNLRRQIFIAVCDDLPLRDRLAHRLQEEFPAATTPSHQSSSGTSNPLTLVRKNPSPRQNNVSSISASIPSRLVSLKLKLSDPNPLSQISQWLAQSQPFSEEDRLPSARLQEQGIIGFQILGVEHLTRQPPSLQWSFLRYLRTIESDPLAWEFSLLLWISSPWLCCIQQSAPEFWGWRTGVFQFFGEPTPAPPEGTTSEETQPESVENTSTYPPLQLQAAPQTSDTQKTDISPEEDKSITNKAKDIAKIPHQTNRAVLISSTTQDDLCTQILHEIKALSQQNAPSIELGRAYRKLGHFYRDHLLKGDVSSATFTQALTAYERVLECLGNALESEQLGGGLSGELSVYERMNKQDACSTNLSEVLNREIIDVLNDIGTLHWLGFRQVYRGKTLTALAHLEQSIIFYQNALMKIDDPEQQPMLYARLQKNLAGAYADLATQREPVENLQQAIAAYREIQRYLQPKTIESTPTSTTLEYAATQNNLGTAYWNLAQHHEPIINLKKAIAAYTESLKYYPPQQEPLNYGMVQANLGTAYWTLSQHQPSEDLLIRAINAYRKALKYRTQTETPVAYAATQNNLGIAAWHLANQSQNRAIRAKFLSVAIAALEAALSAAQQLSPTQLTFDPLATHNNLGLAHYQLATDSDLSLTQAARMSHLEAALQHHLLAGIKRQPDLQGTLRSETETTDEKSLGSDEVTRHQTALSYLIKTIRAFYRESGLEGQNRALSQIPGHLLPEILKSL